jgi:L-alanine-DL-glutamate epimerase-like enolase superfamily enzyme
MQIESVSLCFLRIPFKHAFEHALKQRAEAETLIVLVRSRAGATGVGEIAPRPYLTGESLEEVLHRIAPERARRCLGKSFSSQIEVVAWLRQELDETGRELATLGGFELAILDLAGKELGFSAGDVLGGRRGPELPPGVVIGFDIKTPELKRYCALLRMSGTRHVKCKVGRPDDLERIEIVSKMLGPDALLRLDANGAWSANQAVERLKRIASRFKIASVEQPVGREDLEGLHRVRSETGVEIMADESLCSLEDGRRLIAAEAVDIFNIRIGKCGGLLGSLRLVELARSAKLGLHLGALVGETAILSRASEIFGRAVPGFACLEGKHQNRLLLEGDIAIETEGTFGLGVEIQDEWLSRYEEARQEFVLSPMKC